MRIVDIRETAIPLKSDLRNSGFDFSDYFSQSQGGPRSAQSGRPDTESSGRFRDLFSQFVAMHSPPPRSAATAVVPSWQRCSGRSSRPSPTPPSSIRLLSPPTRTVRRVRSAAPSSPGLPGRRRITRARRSTCRMAHGSGIRRPTHLFPARRSTRPTFARR